MKKIVGIAAIVVGVLIVAMIAIPLLVNANNFRPEIESTLSSALGRPVKVGNLSLSLFSGSVQADQLSIADDPKFSNAPFIQAKTLRVGVELMPPPPTRPASPPAASRVGLPQAGSALESVLQFH